jgi:hypothetical protein
VRLLARCDSRPLEQIYLELRHIVHYAYDRARRDLALLEQAALTLQSLPAFQAVDVSVSARRFNVFSCKHSQGAISAAASAKKLDDRKNLGRSEEDLIKEGRWLSESDRLLLDKGVVDYLQNGIKDDVDPPDAFEYQNHLIVHWLNGNSVPVLRSEIFCQLQVGRSIRKTDAGQWLIEVSGCMLHVAAFHLGLSAFFSLPGRTWPRARLNRSCSSRFLLRTSPLWRRGCPSSVLC